MKKLITIVLILAMLIPTAAFADLPSLDGMTFDELVELREKLNIAIWNCQEWQEVEVPAGIWKIGEDIPAGHWTIRAKPPKGYYSCTYFDKINDEGTDPAYGFNGWTGILSARDDDRPHQVDLEMKEGYYFQCGGPVIFTPFTGKPDLGFK